MCACLRSVVGAIPSLPGTRCYVRNTSYPVFGAPNQPYEVLRTCYGVRPGEDQTTRFNRRVNPKPAMPMIVSATVHVFSVCGTVMLKNSLISQKPASFTCDSTREPAPVASTSSSAFVPGIEMAMGATMPAAVVISTVPDPVATRMSAATVQARSSGDACDPIATPAMAAPTPLWRST